MEGKEGAKTKFKVQNWAHTTIMAMKCFRLVGLINRVAFVSCLLLRRREVGEEGRRSHSPILGFPKGPPRKASKNDRENTRFSFL